MDGSGGGQNWFHKIIMMDSSKPSTEVSLTTPGVTRSDNALACPVCGEEATVISEENGQLIACLNGHETVQRGAAQIYQQWRDGVRGFLPPIG